MRSAATLYRAFHDRDEHDAGRSAAELVCLVGFIFALGVASLVYHEFKVSAPHLENQVMASR